MKGSSVISLQLGTMMANYASKILTGALIPNSQWELQPVTQRFSSCHLCAHPRGLPHGSCPCVQLWAEMSPSAQFPAAHHRNPHSPSEVSATAGPSRGGQRGARGSKVLARTVGSDTWQALSPQLKGPMRWGWGLG